MLLLWDFCVMEDLSEKASAQTPLQPPTETLPMVPLLDLEKVKKGLRCNCLSFPMSNNVLLNLEENNVDGRNLLLVLVLVSSVNCQES